MSYAASAALQAALFAHLSGQAALEGIGLYDALPKESGAGAGETFVLIGAEEVRDASDQSGAGALHNLVISVISEAAGFAAAKSLASAISEALAGAELPLTRGRLVQLSFERAIARRQGAGQRRRIDMTFAARIEL